MRRIRTVGAAGLATLLVAACGSSAHKTAAQAPTTSSHPATISNSSPPTNSTPATTTTSTPGAASGICRASGLQLSYLGQQGATGHGEMGFALKNVGGQTCHTVGYPGIQFLDASGGALPTIPTHTTHDLAGSVPLRALTVSRGSSVSFRLFVTHFGASGSSAGCATAKSLQVIPPNDTATVRVAIGNGGGFECRTVTVSPVQPGTSAYP